MSVDFQTWMRAVWMSLLEPADMARKAINLHVNMPSLWMALALATVLNVLLLAVMQMVAPTPPATQQSIISLSPFAMTAFFGLVLVLMVFATYFAGQIMDGKGDLQATLTIMVWFHAVNLTLGIIQLAMSLISPYFGMLFGMMALGALLWCFLNFINELHGFESLGKSFVAFILSLFGVFVVVLIVVAMVGMTPAPGGTI